MGISIRSGGQWVSVAQGTAANALGVQVTASSTSATNYLTFVNATSGSGLPILANSNLTFNPTLGLQVSPSLGVGAAAPSGTAGEIRASSNITAYYSDERLKENINPIPSALSKLLSLRGVTFNSNKTAEKYGYIDKKEQVGVIAQDIEKVLPQIVVPAPFDIGIDEDGNEYSKSGENYKTVHYDKIVPLLIEAIKEQQQIIDKLEKRIQDLESK